MARNFHIIFFLFCMSALAISCGKKAIKEKPNPSNDSVTTNLPDEIIKKTIKKNKVTDSSNMNASIQGFDTSFIHIDTVLILPNFKLAITHEKFDANNKRITLDDMDYNSISVYIAQKKTDSIVYKQKFDENQFVTAYAFKNNSENYISLSSFGGGSGFTSTIYKVETEKSFQFKKIFSYTELTYYAFNKDGSEILCLDGIWDLFTEGNEGEITETHFADHAYSVITIDLSGNDPKIVNHGTTKHKYPSEDSGTTVFELFKLIQKKEPNTCRNISLDKYPAQ